MAGLRDESGWGSCEIFSPPHTNHLLSFSELVSK
jgi:hypothetical protein